jgi:hypothetical protein
MFNRPAEAPYLSAWVNMLEGDTSRGTVATMIAESNEAQLPSHQTPDEIAHSAIFRLYRAAFNRSPDQSGDAFWTTMLGQGSSLNQVAAFITQSTEFLPLAALNDHDFITQVYQNLFNRTPEQSGLDFWTALLSGGTSRADVLTDLVSSPEAIADWDAISKPLLMELVLNGAGGLGATVPNGYDVIVDNSFSPDTLTASNQAIIGNTVGGTWFVSGNSTVAATGGDHFIGATGVYEISFGGVASNSVVAGGTGKITTDQGTGSITITGSNDTIDTRGADVTITAAANASGISVIGDTSSGTGHITFVGGGQPATIVGGLGGATIQSGTGGVVFTANSGTGNSVTGALGSASTLFGSANSSLEYDGAGNALYVGISGNTTLDAAGASGNVGASAADGADSITTGGGADTLIAGSGSDTFSAGDGANTFRFALGTTGNAVDFITDTAVQLSSDTVELFDYTALPTATTFTGGSLTNAPALQLSDGTKIVFTQLTDLTQIGHINITHS